MASESSAGAEAVTPTVQLNNGLSIPQIGLGTFLSMNGAVREAVKQAIKMGKWNVVLSGYIELLSCDTLYSQKVPFESLCIQIY